jgi:tetratricopeptide (TPR) repeat protein
MMPRMNDTRPMDSWIREALQAGLPRDLSEGRLDDAAAALPRVLAPRPSLPRPTSWWGWSRWSCKDRRTAVSAFGSVTRLRPQHGAAWAQLARLFMQAGQANRADRALAEAIAHETRRPAGAGPDRHHLLAAGRPGGGAGLVRARPWRGAGAGRLSRQSGERCLVFLGDREAAEAELERSPGAGRPTMPRRTGCWRACAARATAPRRDPGAPRGAAGRSRARLAFLWYALGKEFEDLEEWDRAFAAFARGATRRRAR